MSKLTRGQFLEMLKSLDPDPQFLSKIIVETFNRLPDNYAWQLSQQLYLQYYWEGEKITLTNHLTGIVRQFTSTEEIYTYLTKLGYTTNKPAVARAIKQRSANYCNHQFDTDKKKEITFLEE